MENPTRRRQNQWLTRFRRVVAVVEFGVFSRKAAAGDFWIEAALHVEIQVRFILPINPFLCHRHVEDLSQSEDNVTNIYLSHADFIY